MLKSTHDVIFSAVYNLKIYKRVFIKNGTQNEYVREKYSMFIEYGLGKCLKSAFSRNNVQKRMCIRKNANENAPFLAHP